MSLESDIKLLSEVPLFDDLAGDQLRLLAFSANRRDLVNGEILFREGEEAGGGYVVVFGTIELSTGAGEARRMLERAGPGCLIGELPLFIATRRRSTATAAGVATVLDISRPAMRRMLEEYPRVASSLHKRLAERVNTTIGELRRVQAMLRRGD
ncbi:MAG: cyclic nucleotide-binding domain-containing protein [Bauldia sp.]|nr:cyclic nucleotide-binding domain-containing protein [Bauldia sp.]